MADLSPPAGGGDVRGAGGGDVRGAGRAAAVAVGLVVAIVWLALARIAGGWAALAPDDARYLFVGLSILDGQGALTPSGDPYLMRSPIYGLALAFGSLVLGGDPLVGARLVAVAISLLGLLGAARLGWLVSGPGGGAGAVLALVATPLIWHLLPSLRIDLPQIALVIALLLMAWRPTVRRWAAAGVVLGLVVLVKETALPLLLLPIALIGSLPASAVLRLAGAYVGAGVVTAAWWWVVVWVSSGQIFPANALAVVEARDVDGVLRVASSAVPLLLAFVLGWVVVAWRARHEPGARLLLVAGVALAPLTIYAAANSLNARNFAGLAVLSAIATGIAGATIVAAARSGLAQPTGPAGPTRRGRVSRSAAAPALGLVLAFALVGPAIGQRSVPGIVSDRLTDDLVAWLTANVDDGGRIVMPFREREEVALRRFGSTQVRLLGIQRVDPADPPATFIWMGLRDAQLFGYSRTVWVSALTDPAAAYLVLVSPHPFTPVDLVGASADDPSFPGLTPVTTLESGRDHADILRIDPAEVLAATGDVPLHLAADAATAWLDQAGGSDAAARLLQARPIVSGEGIEALIARLGDRACRIPAPADATQLAPAGTCPE